MSINRYGYSVNTNRPEGAYMTRDYSRQTSLPEAAPGQAADASPAPFSGVVTALAAIGGSAVAAIGGYFIYKQFKKMTGASPSEPRPAAPAARPAVQARPAPQARPAVQAKPAAAAAKPAAAAAAAPAAAEMSPADKVAQAEGAIVQLAMRSLEEIRQGKAQPGEREQRILGMVRSMPGDEQRSQQYRVVVAQWMLLVHQLLPMMAPDLEARARAKEQERQDMAIAWTLMNFDGFDEDIARISSLLLVDIATRMQDADKMAMLFDQIMGDDLESLEVKSLMPLFTTAPLLGRWRQVREIGDRLKAQKGMENFLDELHNAATRRPDFPDYKIMYELAEEEQQNGTAPRAELKWTSSKIVKAELRFRGCESNDEETQAKIEADFDGEWNALEKAPGKELSRTGAIGTMVSIGDVPITLVGPVGNDTINLRGYRDFDRQNGGTVLMEYNDRLARVDETTFEGEHVFRQVIRDPDTEEPKLITTMFDIRITFASWSA